MRTFKSTLPDEVGTSENVYPTALPLAGDMAYTELKKN
jgi:hypothetical protein